MGNSVRTDIPASTRWIFTAWVVFWVAVVLANQGPQNFFWLCNIAQFIILYAIWRGDRLLFSSQAGVVILVGLVWAIDFTIAIALGGRSPTGFTAYMFDDDYSLLTRVVSLYHVGLPVFVIRLLPRMGYDDRGPWLQSAIGVLGILGSWLFTEPVRNVNVVYHPFGIELFETVELLWIGLLIVGYPLVLFFPGHFLVRAILRRIDTAKN